MSLPKTATIATIVNRLLHPLAYVAGAYAKLHAAFEANPEAQIRIGIEGNGSHPNYRTEIDDKIWSGPFRGKNHDALSNGENAQEETWSDETMGHAELQALLLELRKAA